MVVIINSINNNFVQKESGKEKKRRFLTIFIGSLFLSICNRSEKLKKQKECFEDETNYFSDTSYLKWNIQFSIGYTCSSKYLSWDLTESNTFFEPFSACEQNKNVFFSYYLRLIIFLRKDSFSQAK